MNTKDIRDFKSTSRDRIWKVDTIEETIYPTSREELGLILDEMISQAKYKHPSVKDEDCKFSTEVRYDYGDEYSVMCLTYEWLETDEEWKSRVDSLIEKEKQSAEAIEAQIKRHQVTFGSKLEVSDGHVSIVHE